jgi:hypothetical protein
MPRILLQRKVLLCIHLVAIIIRIPVQNFCSGLKGTSFITDAVRRKGYPMSVFVSMNKTEKTPVRL